MTAVVIPFAAGPRAAGNEPRTLPTQRKQSSRRQELLGLIKDMEVLLDQRDATRAAKPPAPVIPFKGKPAAPAIPPGEIARRGRILVRHAAEWGVSITVNGPMQGGAP